MERSTDRLARYTIYLAPLAIIAVICWTLRSILAYIIIAAVVSLIGRPVMKLLKKITIKGKTAPGWLLAIITLVLIITVILGLITQIIPVIYSIVADVSADIQSAPVSAGNISFALDHLNLILIEKFPRLGADFSIQETFATWLQGVFNISSVTSIVGSVAGMLGNLGVGLFSVCFISFFFIKDDCLFRKIIGSLVPDRLEADAVGAIGDIEHLLSRYFVGILLEIIGVALLNFLGLAFIAKIGVTAALGIAFITGLMNMVPYVGPWIGGAIGVVLGTVIKYSVAAAAGLSLNLLPVICLLLVCFVFTQLVDNFLFQPVIYSASIKSSPLEIFIVILIAAHLAGIVGMLVAVPSYTVIRVIAIRFFYDRKIIKRLIPDKEAGAGHKAAKSTEPDDTDVSA